MSTRFVFQGLEELKAALRSLPHDLSGEAGHIVEGATNSAEQRIKAEYSRHRVTGELADHVQASITHTAYGVEGTVKNTSKLAQIFERGTEARHYVTVRGNTHATGRMPPFHVFVPAIVRERRRMYQQLKEMLVRYGLLVSGDA